jgi:acyl-coenzyme A synthetase/AMP-(fatty) acid ligase
MPKGAVLSHRNVLAYSKWAVDTFGIDSDTVFGNQTPFYFSMSVTDIYSTLRAGATLVIIPKSHFTFPINLIKFLNEYHINTIYWVPSAMAIVSSFKLFEYVKPEYLRTVLFAGEVMPTKHLNYWRNNLGKDLVYANLFGPTETTDICTYYVVDRDFADDESLPIGKHCDNCNVFILNEKGELAGKGEEGELYARGSFLSAGYYNNPEKTAEAFVQNPLNKAYPETVYKTGDLVKEGERGEILYICRKDYQIKHMGYRIELGEIETAVSAVEGIQECACVYDEKNDKIVLFYTAKRLKQDKLAEELAKKLNAYLMPNVYNKLPVMPHNQNGKIDRKYLKSQIGE